MGRLPRLEYGVEGSFSDVPEVVARLLSPRPLERSSHMRWRPLSTERSLAESVRDALSTAWLSVFRIQRAASGTVHVYSINSLRMTIMSTKPGYSGVSSSVALSRAKRRLT